MLKSVIKPAAVRSVAVLATLGAASSADAHIYRFWFGMSGDRVVPASGSTATGTGLMQYNHHTFNYSLDLRVTGVALGDLLDTGPNGTPLHIYLALRGQNGDIVLDPGFFGDFYQDGDAIRITLSQIRIGGNQGAFQSSIFTNENAFYDGLLYFQLYTTQYPNGAIRGQVPRFNRYLYGPPGVEEEAFLDGPPAHIPAPGGLAIAALAGALAFRRRR